MSKLKVFCLVFAFLIAVSSLVSAQQASKKTPAKEQTSSRKTMNFEALKKQLNLTAEQVTRFDGIRSQARGQARDIIRDARIKLSSVVSKATDDVESILDAKQKKKLTELRSKYNISLNIHFRPNRATTADSGSSTQSGSQGKGK